MSSAKPNALAHASSAYLRSAMHQPTDWHEWGPEAFALARQQDKPILLDIGAVWCHWCHVMDRESYESPEIAKILNEHFIPVKVDRDERPDVDARHQMAVAAITGQGGWPLTVFLTPEGKPFFGGTYFPPVDGYGRPSFQRILLAIAEAFRERRSEVESESDGLMHALAHAEGMSGHRGQFSPRIVEQMVQAAFGAFDRVNGGFSLAPKFPHPPVVDLLLDWYARTGEQQAATVVETTLEKMAHGGVYDQLAGGFHRYSVDERWCVPHFEKMSYDNSELLKNYVHAWQATGNPLFAEVAADILRWVREWLSDRERGGYYGSQDADINLDDDGDYFTWTLDEARAVLSPKELAVAAAYYDIGEQGEMHHNPAKNVLWVQDSPRTALEQIATREGLAADEAAQLLLEAQRKLYAARLQRPTPFIDRTLYTGWNALMISAVLQASRVLPETVLLKECREQQFALRSLDRLMREAWIADESANAEAHHRLLHVVAYAEGGTERPEGVLDDYAFTTAALLDAYEVSGELRYFEQALQVAERMVAGFYDEREGGFFDRDRFASDPVGALATVRKPFQDSPTPAGNPAAAIALLRLHALTNDARWQELARATLEVFAGVAEQFGIHAGTYGLAAVWLSRPHTQVVVIGEGAEAEAMYQEAVRPFALNKLVLRVKHSSELDNLPPALRETIAAAPGVQQGEAMAMLCTAFACQPPIRSAAELRVAMQKALQSR